jgi:hypothetical protein
MISGPELRVIQLDMVRRLNEALARNHAAANVRVVVRDQAARPGERGEYTHLEPNDEEAGRALRGVLPENG